MRGLRAYRVLRRNFGLKAVRALVSGALDLLWQIRASWTGPHSLQLGS